MRLSFKTRPQHSEWQPIVDFWKEGDRIEAYDAGWTFDHLDPIFSDRDGPVFEGWTMLAALSGIVHRIRLGVMVTGNTYRHPAVLANMAATLDVASRRTSGDRARHRLGRSRTRRLRHPAPLVEGTLRSPRRDLRDPSPALHERGRRFRRHLLPPRRGEGSPQAAPATTSSRSPSAAPARNARFVLPPSGPTSGTSPAVIRTCSGTRWRCSTITARTIGRDPAEIEISAKIKADGDPGALADLVGEFRDAGADHIIAMFEAPFDPAKLGAVADRLRSRHDVKTTAMRRELGTVTQCTW